jgi:hypothetical protein
MGVDVLGVPGGDPRCVQEAITLPPPDRPVYADALRRVLKPGGKLLLRASLRSAGVRNDMHEAVIGAAFTAWRVEHVERATVPSDIRMLEVIIAPPGADKAGVTAQPASTSQAGQRHRVHPAGRRMIPGTDAAMKACPHTMHCSMDHAL